MQVPKNWEAGESKTSKINEILAFLRVQFPDEAGEKIPSWSQAAPLVDSPAKWTWRSADSLLDRGKQLHMVSSLTDDEKAQILEDTGSLEYPGTTQPATETA